MLEVVEAFIEHARDEAGFSPATLDAYRRDLTRFANWCREREIERPEATSQSDIRAFAAAEHRRGLSARSVQRRLSALRRLFGWLRREGRVGTNPAQGVRAPRVRRRLPETLDIDRSSTCSPYPATMIWLCATARSSSCFTPRDCA